MIAILLNEKLTEFKMQEIVDWYWDKIEKKLLNKIVKKDEKVYSKHYEWVKELDISLKRKNLSFKDIVKMPFDLLNAQKSLVRTDAVKIKNLYNILRTELGKEIIEKLELIVCPYCNRNFINSGVTTTAQFDHFYDKAKYPLLAISFYNLIPCCYTCNHTRGAKEIGYSPYEKVSPKEILNFNYYYKNLNSNPIITIESEARIKKNVEVFELAERYQLHIDIIKEILIKSEMLPSEYLNSLQSTFFNYGLGMAPKEFYYGNYLTEENYYKRPLSKLTSDILCKVESEKKN